MTIKTLYSVLGLPPSAFPEEIEDAFNRLKLQYPKAKLETDEAARVRFLALQQAYETLRNPDARSAYDQKLARAGVKIAPQAYGAGENGSGWLSTRNIIAAGLILVLISGMWVYHARQKARDEREAVDRVLRMAEEEKRRAAEVQDSREEQRRAQLEANQERQKQYQERQFRQDAERAGRQVGIQQQHAERQAEYQRQREMSQIKQREREQQYATQAAERAAQQRIREDQSKLRALCQERYGRSDC